MRMSVNHLVRELKPDLIEGCKEIVQISLLR
jgi:hypothetical protein